MLIFQGAFGVGEVLSQLTETSRDENLQGPTFSKLMTWIRFGLDCVCFSSFLSTSCGDGGFLHQLCGEYLSLLVPNESNKQVNV